MTLLASATCFAPDGLLGAPHPVRSGVFVVAAVAITVWSAGLSCRKALAVELKALSFLAVAPRFLPPCAPGSRLLVLAAPEVELDGGLLFEVGEGGRNGVIDEEGGCGR